MRLTDLIPNGAASGDGAGELEVTGLAYDNRAVGPGTLFFCVPGFTSDGHDFAPAAVARGASALVVERALDLAVPQVQVASVRAAMAQVAARFFGDPTNALQTVGITGTNGKTTTAFLIRALLEAAGRRTGLLGTVKSVIGGVEHEVTRTTPEAIDLQRTFAEMLDAGDGACVMEVSSHALELHRADAIHFAAAIFTNLTQDHLDFHETMEDYFNAKRRLFGDGEAAPRGDQRRRSVRQAAGGDARPRRSRSGPATRPPTERAAVETDISGSRFTVETPDGRLAPELAAARALQRAQRPRRARGGARARRPRGDVRRGDPDRRTGSRAASRRSMRARTSPSSSTTPTRPTRSRTSSSAARRLTAGRLHVVFGCGGDRDRTKRPLMGEIATRLADRVIVTSDNPRSEDPQAIIDEILAGCERDVEHDVDRRAAIDTAIAQAPARRCGRDRGQGARAGTGVRGGTEDPVRRCDRRA